MTATIVKPRVLRSTTVPRVLATIERPRTKSAAPPARIAGPEGDRRLAMGWSMVDGQLTARWR